MLGLGGAALVVEHMHSMHETQGSIPASPTKKEYINLSMTKLKWYCM